MVSQQEHVKDVVEPGVLVYKKRDKACFVYILWAMSRRRFHRIVCFLSPITRCAERAVDQ